MPTQRWARGLPHLLWHIQPDVAWQARHPEGVQGLPGPRLARLGRELSYASSMFIPSPSPPPEPRRIAPVEEICPRYDLTCRIERANDVLEGFSRLRSEASILIPTSGDGVTVYPGVGGLQLGGLQLRGQMIVAPAGAA